MIARSTVRGVALVALALTAVPACNKKKPEDSTAKDEAKKDETKTPKTVADVPAPEDLVLEMTAKDPDALVKSIGEAAGFGAQLGADPWEKAIGEMHDPDAQKAMRAFDPHGAVSFIVAAKLDALIKAMDKKSKPDLTGDQIDIAGAIHVKDADAVKLAIDLVKKKGKSALESHAAKSFEGTIWDIDKQVSFTLIGDYVVFADGADAIERVAPYTAQVARKANKNDHDVTLHVPTDALEAKAKVAAQKAWDDQKAKGDIPAPIAAELDKLVPAWIGAIADAGDLTMTMDMKGDSLVALEKIPAKGDLAKYLAGYPTTDTSSLLSLPKGDTAAVYRLGDGLGPLFDSIIDAAVDDATKKGGTPKPGEPDPVEAGKNAKAFRAAIGHEIAYSVKSSAFMASLGGPSEAIGGLEVLVRAEITDAKPVKDSLGYFRDTIVKLMPVDPSTPKVTPTAYTKFGADGQSFAIDEPKGTAPNTNLVWAIKDKSLYIDVCFRCDATMVDDALDPASKNTLASDSAVTAKTDTLKGKDIMHVTYGDPFGFFAGMAYAFLAHRSGPGSSSPSFTMPTFPPAFSYARVTNDGLEMQGEIPVAIFGTLAKWTMMSKPASSSAAMPPAMTATSATALAPPIKPPPVKPIK